MRSLLRGAVGLAALGTIALAAIPSYAAQPAERELLGIRIWRPDKTVLAKYGQPSHVDSITDFGPGAMAAGPMMGAPGMAPMGGSPYGGPPGMGGSPYGGPPGMGGVPGMGPGAAEAPAPQEKIVWTYERGNTRNVFVFNKDRRVVQIESHGDKSSAVTSRGVRLGDSLYKVLHAYGATSEVSNMGPVMTLDYSQKYHVVFELTNKPRKGYVVTGMTVALQELGQPMAPPPSTMGVGGMSGPGAPMGMPGAPPMGYPGAPPMPAPGPRAD